MERQLKHVVEYTTHLLTTTQISKHRHRVSYF